EGVAGPSASFVLPLSRPRNSSSHWLAGRGGNSSGWLAAQSGARIKGTQRIILASGGSGSKRANAGQTFVGRGTHWTVSGVGREQCSAGEVTRYSRQAIGRSS